MEDARRIIARAAPGSRVLQIGAGFIGCIIMEALRSRGVELTVVEMGDRMVPRMMTPAAGTMIRSWCEQQGVRVARGAARRRHPTRGRRRGARRAARLGRGDRGRYADRGGRRAANVDFLDGSGIDCENGVAVDATMQTNVPGVYAAGDVAAAIDLATGKRATNAIQPNAVEQARVARSTWRGGHVASRGNMALNVLDTLGLVSTSFGKWWGEPGGGTAELIDARDFATCACSSTAT